MHRSRRLSISREEKADRARVAVITSGPQGHDTRGDIAYLFTSAHWGQGLASETVDAMCTWLYAVYGVAVVEAQVDTRNEASYRLLERLGFERIRLTRAGDVFKSTVSDEYLYRKVGS